MRILLVDDEEEFVTALAERLVLRGIDADCVTNGMDAVRFAQSRKYDVVVVDIKMPKICGLDVMKSTREKDANAKFIFMTGHGSEDNVRVCREAGGCDCLFKPVNIDVLMEKVLQIAKT